MWIRINTSNRYLENVDVWFGTFSLTQTRKLIVVLKSWLFGINDTTWSSISKNGVLTAVFAKITLSFIWPRDGQTTDRYVAPRPFGLETDKSRPTRGPRPSHGRADEASWVSPWFVCSVAGQTRRHVSARGLSVSWPDGRERYFYNCSCECAIFANATLNSAI